VVRKILIAEDEKPLANALNLKLKGAGFDTQVVYNGDDALSALKENFYDLLLVDIMMPKRDGFSVLEELKKIEKAPPAFVMSNLGQDEDIKRAKSLGAKDYIIKADTPLAEIVKRISAFLK
jgi:DNA-binding response OmpR family regulator